jgi:hypothetical protein
LQESCLKLNANKKAKQVGNYSYTHADNEHFKPATDCRAPSKYCPAGANCEVSRHTDYHTCPDCHSAGKEKER